MWQIGSLVQLSIVIFSVCIGSLFTQFNGYANECKELGQDRLDQLLFERDTLMRRRDEFKMRKNAHYDPTPNTPNEAANTNSLLLLSQLVDQSDCIVQNRKHMRKLGEKAVCPWKRQTTPVRADKYPWIRSFAKCTCDRCAPLSANSSLPNYGCMPVRVNMPVLERQARCDTEGFQVWTPNVEEVSVACVCALKTTVTNYGV